MGIRPSMSPPERSVAPERQNAPACLSRYNRSEGVKPMPILLWLLGVPLSVVVVLWLVHVI